MEESMELSGDGITTYEESLEFCKNNRHGVYYIPINFIDYNLCLIKNNMFLPFHLPQRNLIKNKALHLLINML